MLKLQAFRLQYRPLAYQNVRHVSNIYIMNLIVQLYELEIQPLCQQYFMLLLVLNNQNSFLDENTFHRKYAYQTVNYSLIFIT